MGYVYILTNAGMPNLIKIGYTNRTPEQRASELYDKITGVPMPFEVAHKLACENPQKLESEIHEALKAFRPNKDREFFKYPPDDAFEMLKALSNGQQRIGTSSDSESRSDDVPNEMQTTLAADSQVTDDGLWRKWTSQFLTRFKRKVNPELEESL